MSALDNPQAEVPFEQLLKSVRPRLKAMFVQYRIPPQDTEDILQQALLALLYQRQGIRDPEAWLLGTLKNKCRLYWRDQRRKLYETVDAAVLDYMAEPLAPAQEESDRQHDLELALGRLPQRCRSLLRMRYRHGFETPEVAARLGYSPASISKITMRCLAALTRQLMVHGLTEKKTKAS